jgi:hypothetical protein
MINTSSVRHRDLTFRIRLGGGSATFGIPVISSSNSTGFSITIPGANPGTSTSAEIAYLGSTITYFDHNTRGVIGRVVANSR